MKQRKTTVEQEQYQQILSHYQELYHKEESQQDLQRFSNRDLMPFELIILAIIKGNIEHMEVLIDGFVPNQLKSLTEDLINSNLAYKLAHHYAHTVMDYKTEVRRDQDFFHSDNPSELEQRNHKLFIQRLTNDGVTLPIDKKALAEAIPDLGEWQEPHAYAERLLRKPSEEFVRNLINDARKKLVNDEEQTKGFLSDMSIKLTRNPEGDIKSLLHAMRVENAVEWLVLNKNILDINYNGSETYKALTTCKVLYASPKASYFSKLGTLVNQIPEFLLNKDYYLGKPLFQEKLSATLTADDREQEYSLYQNAHIAAASEFMASIITKIFTEDIGDSPSVTTIQTERMTSKLTGLIQQGLSENVNKFHGFVFKELRAKLMHDVYETLKQNIELDGSAISQAINNVLDTIPKSLLEKYYLENSVEEITPQELGFIPHSDEFKDGDSIEDMREAEVVVAGEIVEST